MMLHRKLSNTFFYTQQLMCSMVLFLLLIVGITKTNIGKAGVEKTSKSFIELYSLQEKTFIGVSHKSSNTTNEFICEEKCDDETKENYSNKNNYPLDTSITLIKPTTTISSKEFVYYNSHCNYRAQKSLYTLFCSWKYFIS